MKWTKRGLLFAPPENLNWMKTHAALPVVQGIDDDLYRVYFSGRDSRNRARIGFFELEMGDGERVLNVSETPVLDIGSLGAFDDNGVTCSWVLDHEGVTYLYYTGWGLGVTVPFYLCTGLAVSSDGDKKFHRVSAAPMLGLHETDPYLNASPCVLIENGLWRMWYVSGHRWEMTENGPKHY